MARTARILPEQGVFHIITRGNNRQDVFRTAEDFGYYLNLLKSYKEEHSFRLYHYCLMTNHVHMILETTAKTILPRLMKQINLSYMHYFRRKYRYWGHFWQDRYKSLLIEKDRYLLACGKYIEMNPVRAKMVDDPGDYAWSSYRTYAGRNGNDLVDEDPLFETLGKTPEERSANYEDMVCERLDFRGKFLGSKEFILLMEDRFRTANTKPHVGRPRRTLKPDK